MKQIAEYFGGATIAVLVAAAVFGIIAGWSRQLTEAVADMPILMESGCGENQAFAEYQRTMRGEDAE